MTNVASSLVGWTTGIVGWTTGIVGWTPGIVTGASFAVWSSELENIPMMTERPRMPPIIHVTALTKGWVNRSPQGQPSAVDASIRPHLQFFIGRIIPRHTYA